LEVIETLVFVHDLSPNVQKYVDASMSGKFENEPFTKLQGRKQNVRVKKKKPHLAFFNDRMFLKVTRTKLPESTFRFSLATWGLVSLFGPISLCPNSVIGEGLNYRYAEYETWRFKLGTVLVVLDVLAVTLNAVPGVRNI